MLCQTIACTLEAAPVTDASLEARALTALQNQNFRQLYQVNIQPYPTALSTTEVINVFVPATDVPTFSRLEPERPGSGIAVREDFLVVREVLDAGQTQKLTVMIKGPPGYFPAGGDFFYGVTTPDGSQFLPDSQGFSQHGPVGACGECHARRAQDGFLFGVPAELRR